MKNEMRSEITYLFWLRYVVFHKGSFEPFMCLDLVLVI